LLPKTPKPHETYAFLILLEKDHIFKVVLILRLNFFMRN